MDFSIMFFSNDCIPGEPRYKLLLETARYADHHGFSAIWTPERHFDRFGAIFPNPAVSLAGLATITQYIQLRAGSLISPLHHTIRIAENFSVVDNLSNGRAAIGFGSGWNVNDFVFFPENYEKRHMVMYEQIHQLRHLWSGGTVELPNSYGKDVSAKLYPEPVQADIPIWITSSGNVQTFASAGKLGANLLTHLIGQDRDTLGEKIKVYREARAEAGHDPQSGKVTLMLHTYMGPDRQTVKARVREPFREYLRTAVKLEVKAADGGGTISGGHRIQAESIDQADMESLLDLTFDRYFHTGSLMGSPADCLPLIDGFKAAGVDEIACLVDFLTGTDDILESLTWVNQLRQMCCVQEEDMESFEI